MAFLTDLWLPIVLSAVFVFIVSSIVHMVLPIHKSDYRKMPGEDNVLEAMRGASLTPGEYMFPCPESMAAMGEPEVIEKYKKGPVGFMTVVPSGVPGMGKSLLHWFLYTVLIGIVAAYIADLALAPGAEYLKVFQIIGAVTFAAYGLANMPQSIWRGTKWSITAKFMFDGLLYALVTAGTFAWLWPDAAA